MSNSPLAGQESLMDQHRVTDSHSVINGVQETSTPESYRGFMIARVIFPILLLIGLAATGFCVWLFGMLMFCFALDGANSQQLPSWLEPFMLIGWPITIVFVVLATPTFVALGAKWWQSLAVLAVTTACCAASYFAGVIALVRSL